MKRTLLSCAVLLIAVLTQTVRAQSADPILSRVYSVIRGTAGASGEGFVQLLDNDKNTKWCVVGHDFSQGNIYIEFQSTKPFVPTGYIMTTGTDSQQYTGRNPYTSAWASIRLGLCLSTTPSRRKIQRSSSSTRLT